MQVKAMPQNNRITGALQLDPEMRFTPSGKAVVSFSLITDELTYQRCEGWEELAEEMAEQTTAGSEVILEGYHKERSWRNREDEEMTVDIFTVTKWAYNI